MATFKYLRAACLPLLMAALPLFGADCGKGCASKNRLVEVGDGYSRTSVNTAVFRGSSVATHGDNQYVTYYDEGGMSLSASAGSAQPNGPFTEHNTRGISRTPTM